MHSWYSADVLSVHRRCTRGTPPLYSKYTTDVLKVHCRCTRSTRVKDRAVYCLTAVKSLFFSLLERKGRCGFSLLFSERNFHRSVGILCYLLLSEVFLQLGVVIVEVGL